MSRRGRPASLPSGRSATARGRLAGEGRLLVRCYSQDGDAHRDYDFSALTMAPALRDALVAAFVKRTAPGQGLTSLNSIDGAFGAVVRLDEYLATLAHPPVEMSQLAPEHIDGFYLSRIHLASAANQLGLLQQLLIRGAEGMSEALVSRLGQARPKKPSAISKQSYSRAEFKRIAAMARADLRAAANRIRRNRALLARHRAGELDVGGDRRAAELLQLLDWADRFADVPRQHSLPADGRQTGDPFKWVRWHGGIGEVVAWLHMTSDEVAAGAVLLTVMTGENPSVMLKIPAAHHRADGYTGQAGTALVGLRKPRRGHRAHMDLALTEIPDWISIPAEPAEVSTRDELHTPFGLYVLLHELTARSRALVGGNRLLVGYSQTGGGGQGRGLRPLVDSSVRITRLGRRHGLTSDSLDDEGRPLPLPLRLDRLRLTYLELHQKPVAHTEQTLATSYLVRNRGNVAEYQKVIADALAAEVTAAQPANRLRRRVRVAGPHCRGRGA